LLAALELPAGGRRRGLTFRMAVPALGTYAALF